MNEKQILEQSIADHQKAIDKAKSELSALDKPKLRHGDYGLHGNSGDNWIKLEDEIRWIGHENYLGHSGIPESNFVDNKVGNLIDDLKAMSEPLDRTSVDGFVMEVINDRVIIGGRRFLVDQAVEFRQKLGQLITTAKRKQQDA